MIPFIKPATAEQRAGAVPLSDEQRVLGIDYCLASAEAILKLDGADLSWQTRAERILKAASGTRKINSNFYQIAWIVARLPVFAGTEEGQE
jgi:hypothetical protein